VTTDDGRRLRRQRNRDSVVDAVLELIRAGDLAPSAEQIADRAGLSARSLFRYFDDVDDLCRAAIARQHDAVDGVLGAAVDTSGTVDERAAAVVEHRVALFDAMGEVGRFARLRAPFQPLVAEQLAAVRRALRRRLAAAFAAELAARADGGRALAAADVLCSFESYRLLRDDQGLGRRDAAAAMAAGLVAVLAPAEVTVR
jgi:AcrR family transcriptional regulator